MKIKNKNIILYMSFVFFSNFCIMVAFLSAFLSHIGFSVAEVSSAFFTFQLTKFIFEIPTGYVSDKYGKKVSGTIGIFLVEFSLIILYITSWQKPLVYLAMFVQGVGYTFISGSIEALFVNSISKDVLVKYNTVERFVYYTSSAVSALYGGFIIQRFGYNIAILSDIIAFSISLLTVALMTDKQSIDVMNTKEQVSYKNIFGFFNLTLFALYIVDFANAFSFVGLEDLYSLSLKKLNISSDIIGLIIAMQLIIAAVVGMFTPRLQKKIDNWVLIYIFPLIHVVIAIPIYLITKQIWLIPLLYSLQLCVYSLYAPVKYMLFQKNIDPRRRATALSVQSIMVSLGSVLFFGFSSVIGHYLSLSIIMTISLSITFSLIVVSSIILHRTGSVKAN